MRLLLLLAASGCVVGDSGDAGGGPPDARHAFASQVLPLLNSNCAGCHAAADENGWMKADAYASMKAWPQLIELANPSASLLLTKLMHEGPAWQPAQAATILSWIQLERDAQTMPTGPEVDAFDVANGSNTVMLDKAGAVGSRLTFTAQRLPLGLYLSNISVTAGRGGVHLTHPLFVTWADTVPSPDPVDSFDTVDMDVAQGATRSLGGGLLLLENVPAGAALSIAFRKLGPAEL